MKLRYTLLIIAICSVGNVYSQQINSLSMSDNIDRYDHDTLTAITETTPTSGLKLMYNWKVDTDGTGPLPSSPILVLDMPFDGGKLADGGTKIKDYVSGFNATEVGPVTYLPTGGVDGKGVYSFSESAEMGLSIPDNNVFDFTTDFAILVWVKIDSYDSSNSNLIVYKGATTGADASISYSLSVNTSNQLYLILVNNGVYSIVTWDAPVSGGWQMVVAQLNNRIAEISVDGNPLKQSVTPITANPNNHPISIGFVGGDNVNNNLNGEIDELKIFKRPLTQEQINRIYKDYTDGNADTHPFSKIVPQETNVDEKWSVCVTPNNNSADGATQCSNESTIYAVGVESIELNDSDETATNTDTLILTAINPKPNDIKLINDWQVSTDNGSNYNSIKILDMPMDVDAKNYINNSNNTVYGATHAFNSGVFEGSYTFDGVDDYIDLGAGTNYFNIGVTTRTISMWIKANEINKVQSLLNWHSYPSAFGLGIGFYIFSDNKIRCETGNGGSGTGSSISTATIQKDVWHHIVFTMDGSVGKTYLDGVEVHDATACARVYQNPGGNLWLGRAHSAFRHYAATPSNFDGEIDEFQIYNRVLSSSQIKALADKRYNVIVPDETSMNDKWKVTSTPISGSTIAPAKTSNVVTIIPVKLGGVRIGDSGATSADNDTLWANPVNPTPADVKVIYDWKYSNDGTNFNSTKTLNMPFDGNLTSATAVKDYTSNTNGDKVGSVVYEPGGGFDSNGSFYFNNSRIDTNRDVLGPAWASPKTIMMWIKPTVLKTYAHFFCQGSITVGGIGSSFYLMNGKLVYHDGYASNSSIRVVSQGSTVLDLNKWYHVVVTWDGTSATNSCKIYLNGVIEAQATPAGLNSANYHTQNTVIGARSDLPANDYFTGSIDEVMMWNRALSMDEIKAMYNNYTTTNIFRDNLILPQTHNKDQKWMVCATPVNNSTIGETVCSDVEEITKSIARRVVIIVTDL